MMEKRRGSGMKGVEKKGLSLHLKLLKECLDNFPHRLRIPVVDESMRVSFQLDRKREWWHRGKMSHKGLPFRTSVSS